MSDLYDSEGCYYFEDDDYEEVEFVPFVADPTCQEWEGVNTQVSVDTQPPPV